MGTSRFTRPKGLDGESTPNLFVANCGPAVGLSLDEIASAFCKFGEVCGVYPADESGARVIVSYSEVGSAQAALKALDGHSCSDLGGRVLHIRNSILRPPSQVKDSVSVCLLDSELGIPGIYLLHDFVTTEEEEELLAAVDGRPWKSLSKRRVQHYGYEFLYEARNVNTEQQLGELPHFVSPILEKISLFPHIEKAEDVTLDQLTVNEYPPGVGLSPHIDTHSTFEGLIFSLSLAGPCIMEFRRYSQGTWLPSSLSSTGMQEQNPDYCSSFTRRSIFLPPRSMLLLSGEGRYAWHHYIPHHKVDMVRDNMIRRGSRRVSFTFRKVRAVPCQCEFPQYCDSQK
ncbi:alkylated DNA repair protein ALKBH8 homolog isoform X1 [Macadamia integrifolia]|uniref:alkylated DNA repair protein ALKBH8 homolog isoform X1 n=1 Tax=Macadamia integrifolia TaxID=60698 RepID=UPI001C4EFC92|nr:alkylated DNA repair protein ALKBH8 homolog isoform X1 [Macadamia integrifolia]